MLDFQMITGIFFKSQPDFSKRTFQTDLGKQQLYIANIHPPHFHIHIHITTQILYLIFGKRRATGQFFYIPDSHCPAGRAQVQLTHRFQLSVTSIGF